MKETNTTVEWLEEGVLTLPERVNIETAPVILSQVERSARVFDAVDFVKVKQVDSVALAMLLNWQALAGQPLKIKNLPSQLATLIDLYDLNKTLVV